MINAVSSTPANPNQPTSPMGAGPAPVPPAPVAPIMPAPPVMPAVTEHPVTPMGMPSPTLPPTPAVGPTPVAAPVSSSATPFTPRPDLRENKTSFAPPSQTVTTTTTTTGLGNGNAAGTPPFVPKKKNNVGIIAGMVALLILVIGGGAAFFLTRQNQDVRQQASTGVITPGCTSACQTDLDCPASHSCSANKCVLTACLASGASCDANKCVVTNSSACSLNFVATAPTSAISCQKVAYQDELSNSAGNYTLTTQKSTFAPGDVVVFKVTVTNNGQASAPISLSDLLSDNGTNNLGKVTFLDSDCGATAYNSSSKTLNCSASTVAVGASVSHIFRVKLAAAITDSTAITNSCVAASGSSTTTTCNVTITVINPGTTPTPTPTPIPTPTPSPTPTPNTTTYACNSGCTTDAQCQTVNASYICDANHGNTCRLDSNRDSSICQVPNGSYACNSSCTTDAQCQTANANYVCSNNQCRLNSNTTASNCQPTNIVPPTPAIGCNQTCATNADCASINHICVTTADGLRCRLDNYVNSDTCTAPGTTSVVPTPTTTTIAEASPEPEKPATLPKTGSTETTVRFLIMGAGAVVLGALGLLLL